MAGPIGAIGGMANAVGGRLGTRLGQVGGPRGVVQSFLTGKVPPKNAPVGGGIESEGGGNSESQKKPPSVAERSPASPTQVAVADQLSQVDSPHTGIEQLAAVKPPAPLGNRHIDMQEMVEAINRQGGGSSGPAKTPPEGPAISTSQEGSSKSDEPATPPEPAAAAGLSSSARVPSGDEGERYRAYQASLQRETSVGNDEAGGGSAAQQPVEASSADRVSPLVTETLPADTSVDSISFPDGTPPLAAASESPAGVARSEPAAEGDQSEEGPFIEPDPSDVRDALDRDRAEAEGFIGDQSSGLQTEEDRRAAPTDSAQPSREAVSPESATVEAGLGDQGTQSGRVAAADGGQAYREQLERRNRAAQAQEMQTMHVQREQENAMHAQREAELAAERQRQIDQAYSDRQTQVEEEARRQQELQERIESGRAQKKAERAEQTAHTPRSSFGEWNKQVQSAGDALARGEGGVRQDIAQAIEGRRLVEEQRRQRIQAERNQAREGVTSTASSFNEFDAQATGVTNAARERRAARPPVGPRPDGLDSGDPRVTGVAPEFASAGSPPESATVEAGLGDQGTQSGRVAAADGGRGYQATVARQERLRSVPSGNDEVLRRASERAAADREEQRIVGEILRRGYSRDQAENPLYQEAFRQLEQENQERQQRGEPPLRMARYDIDTRVAPLQAAQAREDQERATQAAADLRVQVEARQRLLANHPELADMLIPIEGGEAVVAQMQADAQTERQRQNTERHWDRFVETYHALFESGEMNPDMVRGASQEVRDALERRRLKQQQEVDAASQRNDEERRARRREQDRQRRASRQDGNGQVDASQDEVVPPGVSRREAVTQFAQAAGEPGIGLDDLAHGRQAGQTGETVSSDTDWDNAGLELEVPGQAQRNGGTEAAPVVAVGSQEAGAAGEQPAASPERNGQVITEGLSAEQRLQGIEVRLAEMTQENARLRQALEALVQNPNLLSSLARARENPQQLGEEEKNTLINWLLGLLMAGGMVGGAVNSIISDNGRS